MPNIHQTLTDKEGKEYKVVSSNWLKSTVCVVILNFLCLITITYLLLDNVQYVAQSMQFNDKIKQRNKAMDEMLLKRAENQQWTYNMVCEFVAKPHNQDCLPKPEWWATPDGEKYNLIMNDASGTGLFPAANKERK
jgi:hypothetical protein